MAIGTPVVLTTGTFGNTSSATISLALTTGDLLVVVFDFNGSRTISTITWNGIALTQDLVTAASAGLKTATCSLPIASGATANLAITLSGSARGAIIPIRVTGLLTTTPTDKTQSNTQSTVTAPTSNATATLTQAVELAIGSIGNTSATIGGSWSNGFTDLTTVADSASATIDAGYLIVAATTALTAAKTGCTSSNYASGIVTYKGISGSAFTQSLTAATATMDGGIVRRAGKVLSAGLATFAGGIAKQTKKVLNGAMMTFGGAISKQGQKIENAAMATFAGTLIRQLVVPLMASMATFAGALTKQIRKILTAGLPTFDGSPFTKLVSKNFAASMAVFNATVGKTSFTILNASMAAFAGAIAAIHAILLSLSASMATFAGTIKKLTQKFFNAS